MKRLFDLFLRDILTSIDHIQRYIEHLDYAEFVSNQLVIDAVVRNLEIIGEAVAQIPDDVKVRYADVPWQKIKDFRNVVVHKYFVVDLETLWDIVQNKLEPLQDQVQMVLEKEKKQGDTNKN